jgi:hypothetical protein
VNNEKLLEKFFRALRVSLTNAFSYSKDHPYFIKSVENFKVELEDTLTAINPLKIGVTSLGLLVGQDSLPLGGFYDELVRLLHQRKIKSIEIRSGADLQELIQFLSVISLPQKDILKSGGINAILEHKMLIHFIIEELDYSEFLHGQGQECSDVWGYMLKNAADSKDAVKLEMLADNFGSLIKRSSQKDILETEDVPSSIGDFLISLKEKNKEKFDKCSKDVFLWFLHNKKSLSDKELKKLEPILKSLNQDDFSNLLWEGITQEDNFDDLSLQIFSKISEQKNQPKIAEKFLAKISQPHYLKNNPAAVKRIQNLLNTQKAGQLSEVYRNTLESLVKGISPSGGLVFDQKMLRQNYYYIVLSMLLGQPEGLAAAAKTLEQLWPSLLEDNDVEFLKSFSALLLERKNQGIGTYINLEKKFSAFIENFIFQQPLSSSQKFLLKMVSFPSVDINYYLDKIFTAQKPNEQILILFFKLFTQHLDEFYQRLDLKLKEIEFLASLVEILGQINNDAALSTLEHLYPLTNELIRIEILKVMVKLKNININFLLSQLNTSSYALRKNLFSVLILDEKGKDAALKELFNIHSFLGKKNGLVIDNIQIISDLKFSGALPWLKELSQRKFFWNGKLREKAKQALKEFNVS